MSNEPARRLLPDSLLWLADAPLFIDADLLERFYDAVVKPQQKTGKTTLEITSDTVAKLEGKASGGFEVSLKPNDLFNAITSFFPFLKPEAKLDAHLEAGGAYDKASGESRTVELYPIETPQRQLVQLALHYVTNHPDRYTTVLDPSRADWRSEENIQGVPRHLVFLDLPNEKEAQRSGQMPTKLIPMAAEFADGKVVPLYVKLQKPNGERPPSYPEPGGRSASGAVYDTVDALQQARKQYWDWFEDNFSVQQAAVIVEEAAFEHGRIHWIDYRVPLSQDGSTLHLHLRPAGKYDTGDFAYNFIKRGRKHGLRLVGTLKSEPDMNVFAIYEK